MSYTLGKFRGVVIDVNDPLKMGRVRLRIPSVLGEIVSNWANTVCPYYSSDNVGTWIMPDINDNVWVEFEEGNVSKPLVVGGMWKERKTPIKEFNSEYEKQMKRKIFKTKTGSYIEINDTEKHLKVEIKDSKDNGILIDTEEGNIEIKAINNIKLSAGGIIIYEEGRADN